MLRDKAYDYLKNLILSGKAKPNQVLSENAIAKELKISRSPLRDAAQQLEKEGLVKIIPKKGIIVKALSLTEAREISELRESIETYIVRGLIKNNTLSNDLFERLEQNITKQKAIMATDDLGEFMTCDAEFHCLLVEEYQNTKFLDIMSNYHERIYQSGLKALRKPGRMQTSLEEHLNILECLKNRDIIGIIPAMEKHFENGRRYFM
ncbi:GntR family transcriptional regulator [candidate division NPL-UPA2 bacterium]|nr:GntR family transcriptional regulator [candidate division NPL-UPA2 bacterium]